MFLTKSRSQREADKAEAAAAEAQAASLRAQAAALKDQAAGLKNKVSPTAQQARDSALHAAEAARGWAGPRLEKARELGVEKAAPRVGHAAESLTPKVDAARDKIVDELLPRIVEAVSAAAAAAAAKADEARDAGVHGLSAVSQQAKSVGKAVKPTPPPNHRKRNVFVVLALLGAAVGAAVAAWKKMQPSEDPWVTATATSSSSSTSRLSGGSGSAGPSSAGLGAGSLATESTDVDTPRPDGLASGPEQVMDGGEVGSDRVGSAGTSPGSTDALGGTHVAGAEGAGDILDEENRQG